MHGAAHTKLYCTGILKTFGSHILPQWSFPQVNGHHFPICSLQIYGWMIFRVFAPFGKPLVNEAVSYLGNGKFLHENDTDIVRAAVVLVLLRFHATDLKKKKGSR